MTAKRSPNCPAHSLEEAIEKVRALYAVEGRNSFSGTRAVARMGYTGLNGASRRALGAVRGFGLLEGRGPELRVSNDAVLIIADADAADQADRQAALLRCLRHNRVFCDLHERFGREGAAHEIASYLQKKYHFKPRAAEHTSQVFINSLRLLDRRGPDSGTRAAAPAAYSVHPAQPGAPQGPAVTGSISAPGRDPEGPPEDSESRRPPVAPAPVPDPGNRHPPRPVMSAHRQDSFELEHGMAQLRWPVQMSQEEFEDFTDWLLLEHRKISRRVAGGLELLLRREQPGPAVGEGRRESDREN